MAKLPVMLLKDFVILPNQEVKLEISSSEISDFDKRYGTEFILISPFDTLEEEPDVIDFPNVVVVVQVQSRIVLPNQIVRLTIVGLKRVKVVKFIKIDEKNFECEYKDLTVSSLKSIDEQAYKKEISNILKRYVKLSPLMSNDFLEDLDSKESFSEYLDFVLSKLSLSTEKKLCYVEEINLKKRADKLLEDLTIELKVLKLDQKINESLQEGIDESQKEYILRERMKEIQKELGLENKKEKEVEEYFRMLSSLDVSHVTKIKIRNEIKKYEFMHESSHEISSVRSYLELFFSLPWNEETIETEDLKIIEKTLNKSHYGLQNVKQRILEYAAMKKRNPMLQAPILCLVGPPGVGKSTIASSIAEALHRKFYKISVGGLNDSSELTGHRRTYIGSAPGKIITAMQKCGSKNPLILIDEVDKMVKDYKGDPASVLLDILDPNLNQNFIDSYLEEPMDLSHVLFFLTANRVEDIPSELRDRLEVIEISSYSTLEKIHLAHDYLLPHIFLDYHILEGEIDISDEALSYLILNYTNEAGVRDLKRKLEELYRKVILHSAKNEENLNVAIEIKDIKRILEEKVEVMAFKPKVLSSGFVCGLAVTSVGGTVLPIESVMYEGDGKLEFTGLIGDVMKESLDVVFSYVKSNAKEFQINENFFQTRNVHIHALEGAIPKDGPSAGVAITTSLISLYTNKRISTLVAMTGEMTLRGEILPVGGIKEKVIGAYNRGIKKIFIPEANKVDIKKLPKEVKDGVKIILVREYKEIYKALFLDNSFE